MKQYLDRGEPIKGINRTIRDSRVPYSLPRSIDNFSMPDSRLKRRSGYKEDRLIRNQGNFLSKQTGSILVGREGEPAEEQKSSIYKTPLSYAVLRFHSGFRLTVGTSWTREFVLKLGDEEQLVANPFKRVAYKAGSGTTFDIQLRTAGVYVLDQTILSNYHKFDNGTISATNGLKSLDENHRVTVDTNHDPVSGDRSYHVFPLTTMAISYTNDTIQLEMGLVEKTTGGLHSTKGVYWPREINLTYAFSPYTPGTLYHIAVVYDLASTTVHLYVDGVSRDTYVFGDANMADVTNYGFIGEYDNFNGVETTGGLGRDIVLLNECTVRGSYSSAVRIQTEMNGAQTFYQSYDSPTYGSADDPAMPWACSPPRGTAMRALRFWSDARSAAELLLYSKVDTLEDSPGNLIGRWELNDGSGVCTNKSSSTGDIVVHHGYPTYLHDVSGDILHSLGLRLSDGQHVIFSTNDISHKYIQDASLPMRTCFGYDPQETKHVEHATGTGDILTNPGFNDIDRIKEQHDATVQIQFKTPVSWQLEWNKVGGSSSVYGIEDLEDDYSIKELLSVSGSARETRVSMLGSKEFNDDMVNCLVRDGGYPSVWAADYSVSYFRDGRNIDTKSDGSSKYVKATTEGFFFFRPYDMTLFSIEGRGQDKDSGNYGSLARVPLMRGFITPAGKLGMEISLAGDINSEIWSSPKLTIADHVKGDGKASPQIHRVIGETTLAVNTVYTATFVKRATYNTTSGRPGGLIDRTPSGQQFEIWLQLEGGTATQEYAATPYKRQITHHVMSSMNRTGSPVFYHDVVTSSNHPLNYDTATGERTKCEIRGIKSDSYPTTNFNGSYDCIATNGTTGIKVFTVGVPDDTLVAGSQGMYIVLNSALRSSFCRNRGVFDVIIGATGVNHSFDNTITQPQPATSLTEYNEYATWLVPQRFMSCYQDQVGNFTLGFFRLWAGVALQGKDINAFGSIKLSSKDYSPHLVINIELEEVAGNRVLNKCRYPGFLRTGYKSWGAPQSAELEERSSSPNATVLLNEPVIPGAWMMEDCLGYEPMLSLDSDYYTARNAICNCLSPFQTTITQAYGLLVVFDDHLLMDANLNSNYIPLYITGHGMLNDFTPGGRWKGTSIGDRTILTSVVGLPKVFNGKTTSVAGFKDWTGGSFSIYANGSTSGFYGEKETDLYYGFRIVYSAEEYSIQHMSETNVIKIPKSDDGYKMEFYDIPPHYDSRVTAVQIYRTRGQLTKSLAESADLFPVFAGAFTNSYHPRIVLDDKDEQLFPAPLDRSRTAIPICAFGAAMNGRLYLAGSRAVPDAIYFSVAGNPETFDVLEQIIILEEGSGDKITGLVAMFGILFVFKANSTWRVEEISGTAHQVNRIGDVGPVSEDSLQVFTIPKTGRTGIFFWSQYGPYMFDGSVIQYIGPGIEDDGTGDNKEFSWLDPESIVTLHNVKDKEIICFYKKKAGDIVESFRTEAIVFNYRFQSWYRYTGVSASASLSASFTGFAFDDSTNMLAILPSYTNTALAFIGGSNGHIYKWGDSDYDGIPDNSSLATTYELKSYATASAARAVFTLASTVSIAATHAYIHLFLVIVDNKTGKWYTLQIEDNITNGSNDFEFTTTTRPSFTPILGDTVYLCLAPAEVIFPWDIMDLPFNDKQILTLITWHKKDFKFRVSKNWDDSDIIDIDNSNIRKEWHDLDEPDVPNGRRHTVINSSLEAMKLQLVSFKVGSSLDAFAYEVDYKDDGTTKQ